MRVLVTGGAGFVGSHIVDGLLGRGDHVLVVDDLSTGSRSNLPSEVELVELDIGDPGLTDIFAEFRPEAVSHCAAQISVPASMKNPVRDARTNILGGINVWQAAISAGCDRFVYITTGGALYGNPGYLPCDEDHPIRPISGYGLSKWVLERYLQLLLPDTITLNVLRLANVYGPRQVPQGEAGVVAIFAQRMVRGEPVTINGDGRQTRDLVYVGDVARAHEMALEASESLTVNIGTGSATSVSDLFRLMAGETGYALPPVHQSERPGDVEHIYLDISKAERLLGWTPQTSLQDGLRETLAWTGTKT